MSDKKQGILYIILAGFFFALMSFFIRMSGDLPTMQKAFFRNAVAAVIAFFLLRRSKVGFHVEKSNWPDLFLRSLCGTIGLIANYYAIDKMNIADANILNKLSPFFAVIASYFLLKEKANKVDWISIIVAFMGALLVIKPSFNMEFVYALVGVIGGLGAGIAYTFVRRLGKNGVPGPIIVFVFSMFSSIVTFPFLFFGGEPMSRYQLLMLVLAGFAAAGGQLSITKAYTKAPAKEISVFDYTQVLFAAALGFIFLDQLPDILSFLGYVVIIGSAIFKWRYSLKQAD